MNQLAIDKSNLMYFRFGPIIAHHKLSSDFISELNKRVTTLLLTIQCILQDILKKKMNLI